MFHSILIACIGNVCRSPMAEAILKDRFARRGLGVRVESAGISALVGRPAERFAQELMRERGLDISAHRARQLTRELVTRDELILVMEAAHQKIIEAKYPTARGRVHRIGRWGAFDVPDPFRGPRAEFEQALALIDRGVADLERAFWA